MRTTLLLILALFISAWPVSGQTAQSAPVDSNEEPRNVTYCELAKDPAAYNHALIRLTAFVSYGFENFELAEPGCPPLPSRFSVWVMYGGKAQSGAVYCCPGEGGNASRSRSLVVDGIEVPLQEDLVFHQFIALLKKEFDTTVRVTVVGRFFAGEKQTPNSTTWRGGYGHLGCCSLFAIQQIEKFEPHTRNDVDYSAEAGWNEAEGCDPNGLRWLRHVSLNSNEGEASQAIAEQAQAESGERAWAFTDPRRVALESLKPLYKDRTPRLRRIKESPVRQVFRWKDRGQAITVVVTRPYWLSFFSKSGTVAWVSTMIKEAGCN